MNTDKKEIGVGGAALRHGWVLRGEGGWGHAEGARRGAEIGIRWHGGLVLEGDSRGGWIGLWLSGCGWRLGERYFSFPDSSGRGV